MGGGDASDILVLLKLAAVALAFHGYYIFASPCTSASIPPIRQRETDIFRCDKSFKFNTPSPATQPSVTPVRGRKLDFVHHKNSLGFNTPSPTSQPSEEAKFGIVRHGKSFGIKAPSPAYQPSGYHMSASPYPSPDPFVEKSLLKIVHHEKAVGVNLPNPASQPSGVGASVFPYASSALPPGNKHKPDRVHHVETIGDHAPSPAPLPFGIFDIVHHEESPGVHAPSLPSRPNVQVVSPPSEQNLPVNHPAKPRMPLSNFPVPVGSTPSKLPHDVSASNPITPAESLVYLSGPELSATLDHLFPSNLRKRDGRAVSTPTHQSQGSFPAVAPSSHAAQRQSSATSTLPPFKFPRRKGLHSTVPSPSTLFFGHHSERNKVNTIAPVPSSLHFAPASKQPGTDLPPTSVPPSLSNHQTRNGMPVSTPLHEAWSDSSPPNCSTTKGSFAGDTPSSHTARMHSAAASAPSLPPFKFPPSKRFHSPASFPSILFFRHHSGRNKVNTTAPAPSSLGFAPVSERQGPNLSPTPVLPSQHNHQKINGIPVAKPSHKARSDLSPPNFSTTKGFIPVVTPSGRTVQRHSSIASAPLSPIKFNSSKGFHFPVSSPSTLFFGNHSGRNKNDITAPAPSSLGFVSPSKQQGPEFSPTPVPPSQSIHQKNNGIPVAEPPNHSATKPPSSNATQRHPADSSAPISPIEFTPSRRGFHSPASSPATLFYGHNSGRKNINSPASAPSSWGFIPTSKKDSRSRWLAPSPQNPVSPSPPPHSPAPSDYTTIPFSLPGITPSGPRNSNTSFLPPPPPNEDCASTVCPEPFTNTPPGSPCSCVIPMQVELRLSVELLTFFPLVSELALEIATGVFMKESQIRIIGANAATQQPDKTIVLIDLVPLGETFDNTTAFLTYQRFWQKQVVINPSLFGDYEVLYVHYPGLPPSPPMAASNINIADNGPYSGHGTNGRIIQPLGVDVPKKQHKSGLRGGVIAIIALSGFIAIVLCSTAAWGFFKHRDRICETVPSLESLRPSLTRPAGTNGSWFGSETSSPSLSYVSSIVNYTGSTKTFGSSEIERATDNFNPSRILGEGGFGRVYSGVLLDGTKVAVKVLKSDDRQGGREFLAEVEMLSRLHHRNLVKLIAICIEERARCLVYELIPNGSVESHLHGVDKEISPLDWNARIKIALGAARGLAYLHEDSSPRVIHRDFKSSNILLEHDFMPKVSDFGLARTAMEGENSHISTRVMGTFGYVAPEYAMTGHLLVKSDVYSYGVVLLELLTGRRPVDMTQPIGQENLVTWARPLLTSKETLQTIVDPSLGPNYPLNSVAKVAAIASMCVQPEVSHRPFMGEVVQALKLVCNECEVTTEVGSMRYSREDMSIDLDIAAPSSSDQLPDPFPPQYSAPHSYSGVDPEVGLAACTSDRVWRQASGSFRLSSSSGPSTSGRAGRLWQAMRSLSQGSASEHAMVFRSRSGSH